MTYMYSEPIVVHYLAPVAYPKKEIISPEIPDQARRATWRNFAHPKKESFRLRSPVKFTNRHGEISHLP